MSLEGVKQCCLMIDSDKVSDRKNGNERLKSLLNNSSIIASLNNRPSDAFNWSQVFHSAKKYFLLEARKLEEEERSKPNVSQTVLRNRENQKRTAASLPRLVLRKACCKMPLVKAQLIIEVVFKVLNRRNPYLLENFAGEFIQVVLKYILHFRHYYLEMKNENWRELMKMCVWLYENEVPGADTQSVLSVMEGVVRRCPARQTSQVASPHFEVLRHLPMFLRRALLSQTLSSQLSLHASLLRLLVTFSKAMASEWRFLLCQIGEETFDPVLAMWDSRPSTKQTHWLEYFNLQMAMHHPQRAGEIKEESQHNGESVRWRRCLRHLYQLLHDHLHQLARRELRVLTSDTLDPHLLPPTLISLAARLCLKIFGDSESSGYIDVTQTGGEPGTSRGEDGDRSSKRRKIEVGLQPFAGLLRDEGAGPHTIPWYQILLELLTHYSSFFTTERCLLMLETLTASLSECSNVAVQEYIIRCLRALATQHSKVSPPAGDQDEHGTALWTRVWGMTLRLVSGRQCSKPGLALLGTLTCFGLVKPESSTFKLFHQNYVDISENAQEVLLALLNSAPLPKHFRNESALLHEDQDRDARRTLLQYILPLQSEGRGTNGGNSVAVECLKNPPLMAQLMVSLCLREPRGVKVDISLFQERQHREANKKDDFITCLEDIYILSTFCDLPQYLPQHQQQQGGTRPQKECQVLQEEQEFMLNRMLLFSEQLESEEAVAGGEGVQAALHLAQVLIILFTRTDDERLKRKFQQIMSLVTSAVEKLCSEPSEASCWRKLLPILDSLFLLYSKGDHRADSSEEPPPSSQGQRLKHILSSTPVRLFTVILDLLQKRAMKTTNNSQTRRGNSFNQGSEIDDFDFEFEASVPGTSSAVVDEFQEFEDDLQSQTEEEHSDEDITLGDAGSFSTRDQCIMLAADWLVKATDARGTTTRNPEENFLLRGIDLILQLSDSANLDMADIGVAFRFVHSMFGANYCEDNIMDGLEVISNVGKQHSSEPQVAACALRSLAELIQKHSTCLSGDVKSSILTLTKAFAIKQQQGSYGRSVSKAIFSVNVELTKADPERLWSKYEVPQNDRCGKMYDLLNNTSHELRLKAASSAPLLFLKGIEGQQMDARHQDQVFQELYQIIVETVITLRDIPFQDLFPDEEKNIVSSFLLTLGTVALHSAYLEGKALFALCLAMPEHKLETSLVARLLTRVASYRGTSVKALLASNLPYLATQWLQHSHQIQDFPVGIFGHSSAEAFLSEHRDVLLPILLEGDQQPAIDLLAQSCRKEVKELFVDHFPELMARILPFIAAEQAQVMAPQVTETKVQAAKKHYKLLERTLSTETFTTMINTHVGDITLHLLQLVHESHPWLEEEVIVPPNPPSFPPALIHSTLDFVGGIFRKDHLLVVFLASRGQELHKVFLGVLQQLARSTTPHAARQALSSVAVLVQTLLPHLDDHLWDVSSYITRMLVHILTCYLEQLQKLAPHLADYCSDLLHQVISTLLEKLPTLLVLAIPTLFSRLLTPAKGASGPRHSSLKVLRLVLGSGHPEVQGALANLPPLTPLQDHHDQETLHSLQEHHLQLVASCRGNLLLEDEVDNFLSVPPEHVEPHYLTHMASMLQTCRGEVASLFTSNGVDQESKGHQLAHRLVALASQRDQRVALEVCRCLGEMGPISLGSPVFYLKESDPLVPGEVEREFLLKVLKILNRYLTCDDIQVVGAASAALIKVLSTKEGQTAYQDLALSTRKELSVLLSETKPRAKATSSSGVDTASYQQIVGQPEVWLQGDDYQAWVTTLACTLITAGCGNDLITHLLPMCGVRAEFSALLLPFLVYSALRTDSGGRRDVLSRQFSLFFQSHSDAVTASSSHTLLPATMCVNKAALQVLFSVVDFLRTQKPHRSFSGRKTGTPFENNLWLQLDYLQVAQAAHYCGAHFSALLYLQLHYEQLLQKTQEEQSEAAISKRLQEPPLARVMSHPEAAAVGDLMLRVYSSLGDGDGVEGSIACSGSVDPAARVLRRHHRGEWLDAFALSDASQHSPGVVQGLYTLGLFNTLSMLLNEPALRHSYQFSETRWEAAWRLGRWDTEDEERRQDGAWGVKEGEGEGRFHWHMFHALQAFHHQDPTALHHQMLHARLGVAGKLRLSRAESSSSLYPLLSQLQIICEVEAAAKCLTNLTSQEQLSQCVNNLEELWVAKETAGVVEYTYKEQVLAARISTLKALKTVCRRGQVEKLLHKTLLTKSRLSRESQKLGKNVGCEEAMLWAAKLAVPKELTWLTHLEEAQVAKARGDVQRASRTMRTLLLEMDQEELQPGQKLVLSQALTLQGGLLMDSHALPPQTIITGYFHQAVSLLHNAQDEESRGVLEHSFQQLAQYGDQLYRQVHHLIESDAILTKRENVLHSQEELARLYSLRKAAKDPSEKKELERKRILLEKNVNLDKGVLEDLEREQQEYLDLAMKNYINCLSASSKHNLQIYRVVGLWLENSDKININKMMSENTPKMKSYQFVPILYQLVARLSCKKDDQFSFPAVLFELLVRVCVEHPHHSLPVIFTLAHAHANHDLQQRNVRNAEIPEEDRVQAAKVLVERMKKTHIKDHVLEFEKVSLAYLSLANWCSTLGRVENGTKVDLPAQEPLSALQGLQHTAALTRPLMLQPSAQYRPPLIQDWEKTGFFVGGINSPVRLTLRTSDGLKQFELLKGTDDVRQDAVMEQVFGIVNELLAKNVETQERALSMRTYQVVPLSQRSGLIQWCKNTQSFGKYLIGGDKRGGAHKLYYPKDYTAKNCLDKMRAVKESPLKERYRVFQDVLQHFHPVFRHFFLENYPSPHQWYQRRLAYTRSVATNSMVGYVLGLGDRHVENILLDKGTAELVHIDLGIAFELGKILPTPETVPFRMTQDVVDGLGVLGVEGPFRWCCEATLRVLRGAREVLVTVVEVLRHDPLYQWTITPQQAARLQATTDDHQDLGCRHTASMAERVVLRVQQKLAGVEDGFPRSVSDQVTTLLQQATDPSNLCQLFFGWQPYV